MSESKPVDAGLAQEGRAHGTEADLRTSVYDGMLAQMYAALTGGAFLTGFALHLGMGELGIGILAALPFVATLLQLPTAHHLVRGGRRKRLCTLTAGAARLLWLPILLVAFLPSSPAARQVAALGLLCLVYALSSVSFISWLSWMNDLVPDAVRGRFFGTRNMLCGAAGMVVMVGFGHLLDVFRNLGGSGTGAGFAIVFASAVLFGVLSLRFLRRVAEPYPQGPQETRPRLLSILGDRNFLRLLTFGFSWGFAVNLASPFFNVYLLRDLGFSFGFVATLGMLSAAADLVGMRLWGALSDRVKNRPVIRVAGVVAASLPCVWLFLKPDMIVLPVILHLLGGGMWAGINLCTGNLVARTSKPVARPFYLSSYNLIAGSGAAAGSILGGLAVTAARQIDFSLLAGHPQPLHLVFLLSFLFRSASLLLLARVREPEEATIGQLVRVIRSLRGINTAAGFNYLLHPFIEVGRDIRGRGRSGPSLH